MKRSEVKNSPEPQGKWKSPDVNDSSLASHPQCIYISVLHHTSQTLKNKTKPRVLLYIPRWPELYYINQAGLELIDICLPSAKIKCMPITSAISQTFFCCCFFPLNRIPQESNLLGFQSPPLWRMHQETSGDPVNSGTTRGSMKARTGWGWFMTQLEGKKLPLIKLGVDYCDLPISKQYMCAKDTSYFSPNAAQVSDRYT